MAHKILLFTYIIATAWSVSQAVINFEDEDFYGLEADRIDWSKHPCNRPCRDGGAPKTCRYLFVIESYLTMSKACYDCPNNITDCSRPHCIPADGEMKTVVVVDRTLPGPYIQVCLGDTIVVDARNEMETGGTTIHWHGLDQDTSPYMDGVPYVTQCPILPGNTFRYQFTADQTGTYWWHSHLGGQRADGFFGALTIRAPPSKNPHVDLYDKDEHNMVIIDWKLNSAETSLANNIHDSLDASEISTILVNGFGRYTNFAEDANETLYTPTEVFNVKQGLRYRFRMVNAGVSSCPSQMIIDNHTLSIVSLDSNDIVPVEVDSLYMWPGERLDFILNADQDIDNYWIRYRVVGGLCNNSAYETGGVYGVAILRYEDAAEEEPESEIGWDVMDAIDNITVFNPIDLTADSAISIVSLNSVEENDEATTEEVDQQIYITYDAYGIDNYEFHRAHLYGYEQLADTNKSLATFQLNHISFKQPPIPVLPQRNLTTPDMFCNSTTMEDIDCVDEYCACTQLLQVKLNSVVELVFVDEGTAAALHHPLHIHGTFFRVVAMETLDGNVTADAIRQLDSEGKINRTLDQAPLKDTMRIPNAGYAIVRFYAKNPGYWLVHCHYDEHFSLGMALIIKVGEHEDMLPVPDQFPQCDNYVPEIM